MADVVHFWKLDRDEEGRIRTWRLVDANPPALQIWGRKLDQIQGKTPEEIFGSGTTAHYMPVVQKIMTEGIPHTFEDYSAKLDKYFRFTSVPLGEYFITTGSEITTTKKALDALRESEARFRQVAEAIEQAVWMTDPAKNKMFFISPGYERIWGRSCQSLYDSPQTWIESIHPEDRQRVLEAAVNKQTTGEYEVDYRIVRPDGTERRIHDRAFPIRDAGGKVYRIAGVAEDVTERKRADEQIAHLNRVRAILGGVDHAIVHFPDQQQLLNEICRVAVEKGGFKLAWVGVALPDGSVQPVAKAGATEYLDGIRVVTREEPEGLGPVGTAIRENRRVVIEDIDRDVRMAPWHDQALKFGLRYTAAFPIQIADKVSGSFQVYAPRAGYFDASELSLMTQVSNDISFALTAIDDNTRRKRAEAELRQSEERYRTLIEQAPDGLFVVEPQDGRFVFVDVNSAACQMFGYSREQALGLSIAEAVVAEEMPRVTEGLAKTQSGETIFSELRMRRRDGSVFPGEIRVRQIPGDRIQGFVRDLTERKRLEQEVLEIGGHELRRIGQELHDDICQWLSGSVMVANALARDLHKESSAHAATAAEIVSLTRHALESVRTLAQGLTPAVIQSEGLAGALQKLATNIEEVFHIRCLCDFQAGVKVRDETAALHLYRIAQEAISNAVRHGRAREVAILLRPQGNRLSLLIRDNGRGIPQPLPTTTGMGLRGMRYRAETIGATLEIRPAADGGTEVECAFPKDLG